MDIQADFVLGRGGNLSAELEGWRRDTQEMEQKVGNTFFFFNFSSLLSLQMLWELRGAWQQGPTLLLPQGVKEP